MPSALVKRPYSGGLYANRYKKRRVTRVYGSPNLESKFLNVDLDSGTAVASATYTLNAPGEGNGPDERNGRKIRSYAYEYQVSTGGTGVEFMRVILYVPKQSNQTLSLADYGDSISNDEFWVLHDKLYVTSGGAYSIAGQARVRQPLTAEFDAAGNQVRGQVKIFIIFGTGGSTIRGHAKTWYKDF